MQEAEIPVTLARYDERIGDLEEWRSKLNGTIESVRTEVHLLRVDHANRPTWSVAIILSILSTTVGTMAVYIVTKL